MTEKWIYIFRLLRPLNLLQSVIAVVVTGALMPEFPGLGLLLMTIVMVSSYTGAANALNDVRDVHIDMINRPHRPIPSGVVSRREGVVVSVLLFALGTGLGVATFRAEVIGILIISMSLLIAYSFRFKQMPFIGNIVVAVVLGMAFVFSAVMFGNYTVGIVPGLLAFGFTFIREVIKDIQDVEGDKVVGARTIPIVYGEDIARNVVVISLLVLIAGTVIPWMVGIYGMYYLAIVLIGVDIPLIFTIFSIWTNLSPANCSRLASLMKADIFAGLLAIYFGQF